MVWDASPNAGFTTGKPWLPVKTRTGRPQRGLAGRRARFGAGALPLGHRLPQRLSRASGGKTRFLDLGEPVLGFLRGEGDGALLCLFNLSPVALSVTVSGVGAPIGPSLHAVLQDDRLTLGPNAAAFLPVTGTVSVQD